MAEVLAAIQELTKTVQATDLKLDVLTKTVQSINLKLDVLTAKTNNIETRLQAVEDATSRAAAIISKNQINFERAGATFEVVTRQQIKEKRGCDYAKDFVIKNLDGSTRAALPEDYVSQIRVQYDAEDEPQLSCVFTRSILESPDLTDSVSDMGSGEENETVKE
jgi:outer membrane murein-binding lipoprotein Lpp